MIQNQYQGEKQQPDTRYQVYQARNDPIWKQNCQRFNQIAQIVCENIQYYISFAWVKIGWFSLSEQCFLLLIREPNQKSMIGYVKQVQYKGFPFNGAPILSMKYSLASALKSYLLGDSSLKFNFLSEKDKKYQQYLFTFDNTQLSSKWTNLLIKIEEQQNQASKLIKIQKQHSKIDSQQNYKIDVLNKRIQQIQYNNTEQQHQLKNIIETQKQQIQQLKDKNQIQFKELDKKYSIILAELLALHQKQREFSSFKALKQKQIDKLHEQNEALRKQNQQILLQNSQYSSKIILLQLIITQKKRLQGKNQQQSSQIRKHLFQTQQKLDLAERSIVSKVKQIDKLVEKQQNLKKCQSNLLKRIQILEQQNKNLITNTYFVGIIEQIEEKQFLKEQVKKIMKKDITKTKTIYSYHPLNTKNIHEYIDNMPHIVIIIQLQNGLTIGAYSEAPFNPTTLANKSGLLFNLTNRKAFPLKAGKKPVGYDCYYIIFGNSEISIKSNTLQLFSNYGIANSFYQCCNYPRQQFLKITNKQAIPIKVYEIFSLEFKQ